MHGIDAISLTEFIWQWWCLDWQMMKTFRQTNDQDVFAKQNYENISIKDDDVSIWEEIICQKKMMRTFRQNKTEEDVLKEND